MLVLSLFLHLQPSAAGIEAGAAIAATGMLDVGILAGIPECWRQT